MMMLSHAMASAVSVPLTQLEMDVGAGGKPVHARVDLR